MTLNDAEPEWSGGSGPEGTRWQHKPPRDATSRQISKENPYFVGDGSG